jgi:hypothetical protein
MSATLDTSLDFALSWTLEGEFMQRSSHALADGGQVWLVDPVADDEALAAAEALGDVAGVIQLLDRHNRDCEELAVRYGVPHHRLHEELGDAPFEIAQTLWVPRWRELHLWWPERRLLLVSEAVGSSPYFAAGRRAGIHPWLRMKPSGAPRKRDPEHLLFGHGTPLHEGAAAALEDAYANSLRDIPSAIGSLFRSG